VSLCAKRTPYTCLANVGCILTESGCQTRHCETLTNTTCDPTVGCFLAMSGESEQQYCRSYASREKNTRCAVKDVNGYDLDVDVKVKDPVGAGIITCGALRSKEIAGKKGCYGVATSQCLSTSGCMIYPDASQSDGWCAPMDSHAKMRQTMILGLGIVSIVALVSATVVAGVKVAAAVSLHAKKARKL
jgi:hypothetical protein